MRTSRRDFLIGGLSAGAAAPFLGVRPGPSWLQASGCADDPILIVVQARGGYDLFNMLVPADSTEYYNARPTIAIPKASTLGPVESAASVYWHPVMAPFKTLYDAGELALVQNIGYPNPNQSHFLSEKKWYAGDPAITVSTSGWLARYLKNAYQGTSAMPAIDVENRLNGSFNTARVPVLTSAESFGFIFDPNSRADNVIEELVLRVNSMWVRPAADPNLAFVVSGSLAALDDSVLLRSVGTNYQPLVTYPAAALARSLQLAARYITGGLDTHVYYTSTGGFDNHANLAVGGAPTTGTFATRMTDLVDSVKAFLDDMTAHGVTRRIVVMIWSEFSRRFGENGSIGTDHGHGGIAMLAGKHVRGGLYGKYPDLTKATQPYSRWFPPFDQDSTDFRSLYATVLENWLGVASAPILGAQFPLLGAL